MSGAVRRRLRIYNVAMDGFAFAISEETGETVFLPRQLCAANKISEQDVSREIECFVGGGAKGPQANTITFLDVADDDRFTFNYNEIVELRRRIEAVERSQKAGREIANTRA